MSELLAKVRDDQKSKPSANETRNVTCEKSSELDVCLYGSYTTGGTTTRVAVPADSSGNLKVNVAVGASDTAKVDKAAFAVGTDKAGVVAGVFSEDTVSAGQAAAVSISAKRHLLVDLMGKYSVAGDTALGVDVNGRLYITNDTTRVGDDATNNRLNTFKAIT